MRLRFAFATALVLFAAMPAAAQAVDVSTYPGADWKEVMISGTGGVKLHGDLLRPKNLPANAKSPVILSIGPYFNHSGQVGPAGPAENTPYDPVGANRLPSDRFADFVNGAKLMDKGYTFLMVDLRGFGGSTGCLDWNGPGEQSDVTSAVSWAASQDWSSGAVGMYGKSYDAETGLVGVANRPAGLKAVVSQEPVYDGYRYLYGDGITRANFAGTPALYNLISLTPGPLLDPGYNLNALDLSQPTCHAQNQVDQSADNNHDSPYWKARNLIPKATGSNVPLFLTQGFTENNTVGDGMAQFLAGHTGPEQGWLGPWEHVRGNETCAAGDSSTGCGDYPVGRLKEGRHGWFDETMRFYDRYLKGIVPAVRDPKFAIQTNDGKWFAAPSWAPDTTSVTSTLRSGSYTDDGQGSVDGTAGTGDLWTVSNPLTDEAHLAGSGTVKLDAAKPVGPVGNNLVVDVYDLAPNAAGDLVGPRVTRQGYLIRNSGTVSLDLWSADWKFAPGHQIGVRVTDANDDWWNHLGAPPGQSVGVSNASVSLPFLKTKRNQQIEGDPGVQLKSYLADTVTLPKAQVAAAQASPIDAPPAQAEPTPAQNDDAFTSAAPAGGTASGGGTASSVKAAKRRGSALVLGRLRTRARWVYVRVPGRGRVDVTVRSGGVTLARGHRTVAKAGRVRVYLHSWTRKGVALLRRRSRKASVKAVFRSKDATLASQTRRFTTRLARIAR